MSAPPEEGPRQRAEAAPLAQGGRVELRLLSGVDGGKAHPARYEARFTTAQGTTLAQVQLEPGAPPRLQPQDAAPPGFLTDFTLSLLRNLARSPDPWPRRLTRWRAAPEGG